MADESLQTTLLVKLGIDTSQFDEGLTNAAQAAAQTGQAAQTAVATADRKADAAAGKAGTGADEARQKVSALQRKMQEADQQFSRLGARWAGAIKQFAFGIAAPITAAFAVWKGITSYTDQVGQVASMTGAYNAQYDEWRKKRAMLQRVTREDIELYKKAREGVTNFQISMQDLTAKIARNFSPVIKGGLEILEKITKWVDAHQNDLVRFFTVAATVITAVFIPSLLKMAAAFLANPLTWIVAAIAGLILVIDDLITYMRGGKTALEGFWSYFGTAEELSNTLGAAIEWLTGVFKSLLAYLPQIVLGAGGVLGALGAFTIARRIFTALTSAISTVTTVLKVLFTVVRANPVILLLTLAAALAYKLWDAFQKGGGTLAGMFEYLRGGLASLVEGLGPFGDAILAVFDFVSWAVQGIVDLVYAVAQALLNLPETVNAIGSAIADFFGSVWDGIVGAFQSVSDFFTGIGRAVYGAFAGAVQAVTDAFNGIVSGIGSAIGAAVDGVTSGFAAIGDAIEGAFAGIAAAVASAVGFIGRIWDAITSAAAAVADAVLSVFGLWADAFRGLIASIGSIFSAISRGLQNARAWFANAFNAIASTIKGLFGGAVDAILYSVYSIGRAIGAIWDALGSGAAFVRDVIASAVGFIAAGFMSLLDAAASVWAGIEGGLQELSAFFASIISSIGEGIISAFASAWAAVTSGLQGLIGTFSNVFTIITDTIKNLFASAWEFIKSMFDPSALIGKAKGVIDGVKNFFGFGGGEEEEASANAAQERQSAPNVTVNVDADMPAPAQAPAPVYVFDPSQNGAEAVQPAKSNGFLQAVDNLPQSGPGQNPTQAIQNSVNNTNTANYDNSRRQSSNTVTQNNNITINTTADPQAINQGLNNSLALQNERLQRQTLAVENGVRT